MLDAAAPYTVFVTHGICSGKMGQQVAAAPTVNPREMKKMETDIEQLAEEYKNLQTSRQHLEDEIIRYKKINSFIIGSSLKHIHSTVMLEYILHMYW